MKSHNKNNSHSIDTLSLSLGSASILERVKQVYLIWLDIVPHIPRSSRYTLGDRIENKFIDLLETSYRAYFASKEHKIHYIIKAIAILDILKFLLQIAWEGKLIGNGKYTEIGNLLIEIGKMLGGWKKGLDIKKTQT